MNQDAIDEAENFVREMFQAKPHYSFDNWEIMYNHSMKVMEYALKLAKKVECNVTVVAIAALLHDIGKTYDESQKTLMDKHESFNVAVAGDLIRKLPISDGEKELVEMVISNEADILENDVVKDADIIAFRADKALYMAFIKWAFENDYVEKAKKKLERFDTGLVLDGSKEFGQKYHDQMKKDWTEFAKEKGVEW